MRAIAVGPQGVAPGGAKKTSSFYSIFGPVLLALVMSMSSVPLAADPLTGPEAALARLRHPEPARRRAAAGALVPMLAALSQADREIHGGALETALRGEDDPGTAVNLVGALGAVGGGGARLALRMLLQGGDPERAMEGAGAGVSVEVRGAAARALGVMMQRDVPEATVPGARGSWRDEDVMALSTAAAVEGSDDPVAALAVRALAELPAERFLLFTRMIEQSGRVRTAWLRAAAMRGDARLPSVARRILTRGVPLPEVSAALDAVATMRVTELAELVLSMARESPSRSVRRQAVRALGRLGGGFDPGAMVPFLDDPVTAEPALESLARLGSASRVRGLVAWLDRPLASDRRAAAELLGQLDDPALEPTLLAHALAEPDASVRGALWRALAGAEPRVLAAMIVRDDATARDALAGRVWRGQTLDGVAETPREDPGDASTAIVRAALGAPWSAVRLRSPEATVRFAAALAAGVVRDAGTCGAIAEALGREDHETVRVALVQSLARQRCAVGWAALRGLVRDESRAPSDAALAAAGALVEAGEAVEVDALVAWSRDDDALTRQVAVSALGRVGGAGSVGVLEARLANDPEAIVRGAAAVALARRRGVAALPALAALGRYAWTPTLVDLLGRAERVARAEAEGPPAPRTVVALETGVALGRWTLVQPDGSVVFGVTDARGVGRMETDRVLRWVLPAARGRVLRRSIP